jgi:Putative beta-barrel porin 2
MSADHDHRWIVFMSGAIVKAAAVLSVIFAGSSSFAELDFSPYLQLQQVYDSNIFSNPEEESDYVTIGSVGVDFAVDETDFNFDINYQIDQLWYDENSDEDVTYHTIISEADWKVTRDFQLFATETFLKTAEPASSELTQREDRSNNIAGLRGQLNVRKTAFELGYTNVLEMYDDVDTRDSREDILSGVINYYHHWDFSLFVGYDRGWIDYDEEERSDGDYDEVTAGIKGNIAARTTGSARGGYRWQNYDLEGREDFSGPTLYVDINHDFPGRNSIVFYARRTIEESFFEENTYYEVTGGGVQLIRQLSDMFTFSIEGSYQLDDYPVDSERDSTLTKREDEIYSGGANLGIDLGKGVDALLIYEIVDNGSNFSEFDYTGQRATVQARVTF